MVMTKDIKKFVRNFEIFNVFLRIFANKILEIIENYRSDISYDRSFNCAQNIIYFMII